MYNVWQISQREEVIFINLYWFESDDLSVRHVILAPNEQTAWEILDANERDFENPASSIFNLAGVNKDIDKRASGELAVLLDQSSDIYTTPLDTRK